MRQQREKKPVPTKSNVDMLTAFRDSEARIQHLTSYITECEEIGNDCRHFLELYDLNASEQIRVTGVLREADRNRRTAIDEKHLIIAALREIRGEPVPECGLSFDGHFARINNVRNYRPRVVTLEQCLELKVKKVKKDDKPK